MKKFFTVILILVCVFSMDANAQKKRSSKRLDKFKIGAGISLNILGSLKSSDHATSMVPVNNYVFTIPMHINRNFKIEPEIGYASTTQTADNKDDVGISGLRAGIGLFYKFKPSDNTSIYLGPRIGIVKRSEDASSFPETIESTRTSLYFGLGCGAEYFLSSKFSLGGEIQLMRLNAGDLEVGGKTADNQPSVGTTYTNGAIFLRFYFN